MEDIRKEQLNILLKGIKKIVSSKNCPEWIARDLTITVKHAKTINPETIEKSTNSVEIDETYRPFDINDKVTSNVDGDVCIYQIIGRSDPINNINLFTLKIIKGNKANPPGYIVYNVPETMLLHIKE